VVAEQWMTVSEAAQSLGMSRTTLLAAEEAGLLVPMRTPGGHRRYSAAGLDRFRRRSGAEPRTPPPAPEDDPPATTPGMVVALRGALRTAARALDAESTGLYLPDPAGALRFTAAFGVPRWLAERLAAEGAPEPVADAAATGRNRLFDAAAAGFPEPRSTGHGLAAALPRGGVLFLVRPAGRELLPGELRVVDALRELLAAAVADQRRIAALEDRLARIGELARRSAPGR
jgi:excisionase family DNA binding protein